MHESASLNGGQEAADAVRSLVRPASPATEQIVVYLGALTAARDSLKRFLPASDRDALDRGVALAEQWVRRA